MVDLTKIDDAEIIYEITRRFEEKTGSLKEMEFMTKKLLDMNERTRKAEAVKSEFLSLIKNEFNNPLSSLLNMAESLERAKIDEKSSTAIRIINSELLRLDFHFKNIFAATDIEAGEIANYYSNVNFESIFDDVTKMFRYVIEDKNLDVVFNESGNGKKIGDSNKVFMIIMNLASNAIEYSSENSKINISVEIQDNGYYIKSEDFGEGIKAENKKDVFERFAKFATGVRTHMGLGLGLSIVRGFSEAMGGYVDFESEGGWTIFKVWIPTDTEEALIADESDDANTTLFDSFDSDVEF